MGVFLGLAIAALVGVWVSKDARSRGMSPGWGVLVFLLMLVFLPMYLIVRKPKLGWYAVPQPVMAVGYQPVAYMPAQQPMAFCSACGYRLSDQSRFCSGCGVDVSRVLQQPA